jgi:hypothetical protein
MAVLAVPAEVAKFGIKPRRRIAGCGHSAGRMAEQEARHWRLWLREEDKDAVDARDCRMRGY